MTNVQQVGEDLRFVRQAVARRQHPRPLASIYYVWAVYVLVGYTLIDFAPTTAANAFFAAAGIAGGLLSWYLARRWAMRMGECDLTVARRSAMHWAGGIILAIAAAFGLATVIPALRGPAVGQVVVVLIGMVYFLAGVHFDRNLLWLGPVFMAGGILVGFFPRYGWTALGAVIALGLVLPTLLPSRRVDQAAAMQPAEAPRP